MCCGLAFKTCLLTLQRLPAGNGFAVKKLDVTNDAVVKEVVESVVNEYGSVDVLINNAGYGTLLSVEQMPLKQHQDLFDTNYFGMVSFLPASYLPGMVCRKRLPHTGLITVSHREEIM